MTDLPPEGRARLRKAADVYQNERSELVRRDAAQEMAEAMPALLDALNRAEKLVEALREAMPALEEMEAERLVGDEGCLWLIERLREALAEYDGRD